MLFDIFANYYLFFVKIPLVYLLREMVSISRTVNYFMFIKETCFVIRCCYHLTVTFAYFKKIKIFIHMIKTIYTNKFTTAANESKEYVNVLKRKSNIYFL